MTPFPLVILFSTHQTPELPSFVERVSFRGIKMLFSFFRRLPLSSICNQLERSPVEQKTFPTMVIPFPAIKESPLLQGDSSFMPEGIKAFGCFHRAPFSGRSPDYSRQFILWWLSISSQLGSLLIGVSSSVTLIWWDHQLALPTPFCFFKVPFLFSPNPISRGQDDRTPFFYPGFYPRPPFSSMPKGPSYDLIAPPTSLSIVVFSPEHLPSLSSRRLPD